MIAYLKGSVQSKQITSAVIEVGGVGYEVALTPTSVNEIVEGSEIELYIAESIREDSYNLLGFTDKSQRQLFYQLTSVSGVGPKAAMAILSAHSSEEIEYAIASGESSLFAGVSGVGKKTAARIILDLKGKLDLGPNSSSVNHDPVRQALVGLGFPTRQAAEMTRDLPADLSTEEKLKQALSRAKS